MKIWIKLLGAVVLGLIIGFFLPLNGGDTREALQVFVDLILKFGRFALMPLLFFGVMIGTYELRQKKKTLRVYGISAGLVIVTSLVFVFIGAIAILMMQPEGIRKGFEDSIPIQLPDLMSDMLAVVSENMFSILSGSGNLVLPLVFLAFLIGVNLDFDKRVTRPTLELFDSLNRIFFHVNQFILEVVAPGIIVLVIYFSVNVREIAQPEIYSQLFWILTVITFIIAVVLLPIAVFLIFKGKNPFIWLFSQISTYINALASGDIYFSLGAMMHNAKRNQGVSRAAGSVSYSIAAIFSRPGTAIVSIVSFALIIRSYISLQISAPDFFWIVSSSFAISFLLGSVPVLGVPVTLAMLSKQYINVSEDAYLMLISVMPILIMFAVFIDVLSVSFIGSVTARLSGEDEEVDIKDFV